MGDVRQPANATPAFTYAWYSWLAEFILIESAAIIRRKPQDTLSDHVWAWFGIPKKHAPDRSERIRRLLLLAFMTWLGAHFLTGDEF